MDHPSGLGPTTTRAKSSRGCSPCEGHGRSPNPRWVATAATSSRRPDRSLMPWSIASPGYGI